MEKQVVIQNETGLHARPASIFVAEAGKFQSEILIEYNGKRVNAKSILGLLTLGVTKGQTITIVTQGPDEESALTTLTKLVESGLSE